MMYSDVYGSRQSPCGRIVIDCGCTKFFKARELEGIPRYASNLTIWLLGLDYKIANSLVNWPQERNHEFKGRDEKKSFVTKSFVSSYYPSSHIILVIDVSGSMEFADSGDRKSRVRRIDSVVSALSRFFKERLSSQSLAEDHVTLIYFNDTAVISENSQILNQSFLDRFERKKPYPTSGTQYWKAFEKVDEVLEQDKKKNRQGPPPVMMFLTDGESNTPDQEFPAFKTLLGKYPELEVEWVLYGTAEGERILRALAQIKGRVQPALTSEKLVEFLVNFSARIR